MDLRRYAERRSKIDQAPGLGRRHEQSRKLGCVDAWRGEPDALPLQAAKVEGDVVAHDHVSANEVDQLPGNLGKRRRIADSLVRDTRQPLNELRDRPAGIDQRFKCCEFAATGIEPYGANLRYTVGIGVEPGRFEVKCDVHMDRTSVRILRVYPAAPGAATYQRSTARQRQQVSAVGARKVESRLTSPSADRPQTVIRWSASVACAAFVGAGVSRADSQSATTPAATTSLESS